ncbi:MAG: hypothetical protein GEU86_09040 [Actinophytocola sp.]|nr:hypothetical protein [Actinophytocola sp.]
MLPESSRAPVGVDPNRASIARVYDAFLNGKDNYEVDREVLRSVQAKAPEAQDLAVENRAFLIRACRFLASHVGIDQFLDCGSGLPAAENVHQVVQRINPDARVVYVDNDPVVLVHGQALLEENDNTRFIAADIYKPDEILSNAVVRKHIDFTRPLAFLQMGTLHHFVGDEDGPAKIMQTYIDALPSGSYVAMSHFLDPEDEHTPLARKMEEIFLHSMMGSGSFRTLAELQALMPGLEMVDPGIVKCADWWPDGPRVRPLNEVQHCIAGGVGRKP